VNDGRRWDNAWSTADSPLPAARVFVVAELPELEEAMPCP